MKRLLFILLLLLPFLACTREQEMAPAEPVQEDGAPDGKVSIVFSCTLPESSDATKALGETSNLTSMRLAIFGGSGYYKEYVTATLLESHTGEDGVNRTFYNEDGSAFTKKVDSYVFKAEIKLSNTPRTIHFLGNGPKSITIGKASDVLPKLLCNDPNDEFSKETAFWQMIWLPAIKAKDDGNGNYYNSNGNIRQHGEDYMVHPDTQAYFEIKKNASGDPILDERGNVQGGIALIRNWAKIILRNNWKDEEPDLELDPTGQTYGFSNFTPHSFAIVHYPERGTFVPYGGKTGFIGPDETHPDRHYQSLAFDELYYSEKPLGYEFDYPFFYGYKGNLPDGAPFNHDIPSEDDFENGTNGVVLYNRTFDSNQGNTGQEWYDPVGGVPGYDPSTASNPDAEPAVYLYERPAPTSGTEPSFVIIYGRYRNPKDLSLTEEERATGVMCYYKVDLMDGSEYYPIFRNFKYQIQIRKIASRGHDNPRSAAESAGSADVSADVTASHLADISDGKRRMAISPWMSWTFIEGDPDKPLAELDPHLYVKFVDDVSTNQINLEESSIYYQLTPANGGVIEGDLVEIGDAVSIEGHSDYGWRPIRFKVCQPDEHVSKTQTLRILCKTNRNDNSETPLYRDIVITLQSKQTMTVNCWYDRVLRHAGEEQGLNITIPDGLVQSMFPLVFTIEPQEMTLAAALTPVGEDSEVSMPVVFGPSVNPENQDPNDPDKVVKTRFQFERSISWEEYTKARTQYVFDDESRWKTFPCAFKTNCEYSATEIWVANKFFNPACCAFSDYRSFLNFKFTTSIPRAIGADIPVSFGVSQDVNVSGVNQYPTVHINLKNMEWEGHEAENGVYAFTPTADDNVLTFKTTTDDGDVAVTLSTDDGIYEPSSIKAWHFSNVGFIGTHAMPNSWNNQYGSNAVFGMVNKDGNKNLLFGFCVESDSNPDNKKPLITYKDKTGINQSSLDLKKNNPHNSSYSGRDDFYWHAMTTVGGTTPVSFTMSAVGYVEEPVSGERFNGNILSTMVPASNLKSWFDGGVLRREGIKMYAGSSVACNAFIEFDQAPGVSDDGLVLTRGRTYEMKVKFYNNKSNGTYTPTNCELVNVQLEYYTHDGIPQDHLEYEIVSPIEEGNESSFYKYMGANFQYIWDFPRHCQEGVIRIKAPNNRDAVINVMRLWGFKDNS